MPRMMNPKVIGAISATAVVAVVGWLMVPRGGEEPLASAQPVPEAGRLGGDVRAGFEPLARLIAGVDGTKQTAPQQTRQRQRAIFDHVRALDQLLPKETFDLQAVVQQAGREPDRLHQWVRRRTTWVPYRGALRGAQGTLMDRKGNSLDRALLLAGLLSSVGIQARLVRAELSDDEAAMVRRARVTTVEQDSEPANAIPSVIATIDAFAKQTGSDGSRIQQELVRTLELSRVASDNVRRRVEMQSARLLSSLGLTPPQTAGTQTDELASLKDHWWVQWQNGTEWSDLDPDHAEAGMIFGKATSRVDANTIPEDQRHVLRIRVIAEKWSESKLTEQPVISIDVVPSEVTGESVRLQHIPIAWPTSLDGSASEVQQRFKTAALNQHEWLPVLTIGTKRVSGSSILDTGDLNSQPGSKTAAAPAEGVMDALGGGEAPPAGVLTAEWIEYEIQTPGRASRVMRREIFDIVGPDARAAGRGPNSLTDDARLSRAFGLLTETEILALSCQLSSAFVQHLTASRLLAAESVVMALSGGRVQPDQLRSIQPVPGLLHNLAVARGEISSTPGSVYLRSINVLSRHTFPIPVPDRTATLATATDIVANDVASSATGSAEQFASRVAQGVLDTNLEAVLIGPGAPGGSMADLFGLTDSGRSWIAVRNAADVAKASVPPDLRARIETDVRAGFAVLAVSAGTSAPAGWWRVDLRTGDTLGLSQRGWGQALTEYKLIAAGVGSFSICSVGAYLINGAYTARDRAICAIAGIATIFGGAAISSVTLVHTPMNYGAMVAGGYLTPGFPLLTATAGLFTVLADALGFSW